MPKKLHRFIFLILPFLLMLNSGCTQTEQKPTLSSKPKTSPRCVNEVHEFKRGDIIVKPNLNFLPGSASIPNGVFFGHAALVTKGYSHQNNDSLLANTTIVESMALDVPKAYQVREITAYVKHKNAAFSCTSFDKKFEGNRYRLRLNLSESAIDSIIAFALKQKGDYSNWNALKSFPDNLNDKSCWAENSHWYCSLLVWQSVFYVTGLDIDINKGFQVYPNDLIAHPIFDNTASHTGRARF